MNIKDALKQFSTWFQGSEQIWSNGATFDIPILQEAYTACGIECPWKFWKARDTRTIYELANITSKDLPSDKLHHPLNDCERQIWGIRESFKRN